LWESSTIEATWILCVPAYASVKTGAIHVEADAIRIDVGWFCAGVPAIGVGHPISSLADVRRALASSAQIGGPAGISCRFQVKAYSGEPFTSILARRLFSKDDWRFALADEPVKNRPKVAFIEMACFWSSDRKRLTWT
jgi:hypothetical protein